MCYMQKVIHPRTYFPFFGSDLNEAQLLRMLSEDMSLDYIFDCLKEISVFENL